MDYKKLFMKTLLLLGIVLQVRSNCYPSASYKATGAKYSCRLSQSNWASETWFEITLKHCREDPTLHAFIRNFYGIDEINMDFSKKVSRLKVVSFNGKTSQISFKFSTFKANPKYGLKKQIQVQVFFVARFGTPNSEQLLTAIFPADDTSDCSWGDTLQMHDQIFLGGGIILLLLLAFWAVYFYLRHRNNNNVQRVPDKAYL